MLKILKFCMKCLLFVWDYLVKISPVIFVSIVLFFIFLVIIPFFLLGINNVPAKELFVEHVRYDQAFGTFAGIIVFFLGQNDVLSFVTTPLWLLSLINLKRTRRVWVAVALLIGPIVLAYYAAGPYANAMGDWLIDY